ncbi:MAG TPA: glycosyltransferase, partial [Pyrinomonadaceae bacterium]|nr:glycosyltransferase [Pyrinomonadaceae bacterium]
MDGFSIVIPTHGRMNFVENLLRSIADSRKKLPVASEILIIDSSFEPEAEGIYQSCLKWNATYLRCKNDVRRKRNLGIESAAYEIIFFTDSDCELSRETLFRHLETYNSEDSKGIDAVLGLTVLEGEETTVWRAIKFYPSFSAAFSFAKWMNFAPWGTCTNFSVRRDILKEIGGFDESDPLPVYGEDVDLGLRLNKSNYRIICQPKAVVTHRRETLPDIKAALKKMFSTGRADYYLGLKFPERIVPEFPPQLIVFILVSIIFSIYGVCAGNFQVFLFPVFFLILLILLQSGIMLIVEKDSPAVFQYRILASIFELVFEFGKIKESLVKFDFKRLLTKFLYVEEQLAAERKRRIIQMWSVILSLLFLIFG